MTGAEAPGPSRLRVSLPNRAAGQLYLPYHFQPLTW